MFLLACSPPFPCADDQAVDKDGACHDLAGDSATDPQDSGDSASPDSEPTDSGATDSDETGDSEDSGDPPVEPDGWPANFVAPYVDATAYPTPELGDIAVESEILRYTLGFVVASSSGGCEATWGTYYSIETGPSAWGESGEYFLYDEIDALRALGGDVMVSFGGAANSPIEAVCPDVDAVLGQYIRVIEALDLTRVDFDIEGSWVADADSIALRSEAIVALQAWAAGEGRDLHVWYTLPVLPSGLTPEGVDVLQSAADAGVELDGVNVMTMDYGDSAAPDPEGQMGQYGIDAITALHGQLGSVFPDKDEAALWGMVGSTPMIGQNDVSTEVFTLDDAALTREFAEENGVGMLGWWSVNRDHDCASEVDWAQIDCHGFTDLGDWAYAAVFAGYGD